jgi:hypothetical protein
VIEGGVTWAIAGSLVGQIAKFVANIFSGGKYICTLSILFQKGVQARRRNRKEKAPGPFSLFHRSKKWNVYPDRGK